MNILIISPESYPVQPGESIVTAKLIVALQQNGHKVFLINNPFIKNPNAQIVTPDVFNSIKETLVSKPSRYSFKSSILSNLIFCAYATIIGFRLIQHRKINLIITRVMPTYGHLAGLLLSYFHSIPWFASWSDPSPVSISPKPYGNGLKPHRSSIFLMNRLVARRAFRHVFPNAFLEKYMCGFYPKMKNKSLILPHIALEDLFINEKGEKGEKFILTHIGALNFRNPELFLRALDRFRKTNSTNFLCRFIWDVKPVMELVDKYSLSGHVECIEFLPYVESLTETEKADVAIVLEAIMDEGIFLPSKVADYIQAGKPILAVSPKTGVMNKLLEFSGGIAVDNKNEEDIYNGIVSLFAAWKNNTLSLFSSANLRPFFSGHYVSEQLVKEYYSVTGKVESHPLS